MAKQQPARGRGIPLHLSRERIVAAALGLVRAGGVSALSMRRLATELDATVAITYHYFPNKAAVVEAVADVVVDAVLGTDDPRAQGRGGASWSMPSPRRTTPERSGGSGCST